MSRSAAAKRHDSGTHPAVVEFREKLISIEDHTAPRVKKLNQELQDYLDEVNRTSSKPPPP